jgi:hypothetical protein
MALASLAGIAVMRGVVVVPFSGIWHADLVLAQATGPAPTGPQSLIFAGSTWTCAVVRSIDFAGERGVRVVGGLGGWRTTIPAKQYGQGTITTQMVATDAALACGESPPVLDASVPVTVGSAFLRQAGPASLALQAVLGDAWWVDSAGTVQTRPRTGTVASSFQAMRVDGAEGVYEVGTDAPNDWTPGATFSSPTVSGTVNRVTHRITPTKLRTEVMAA